MKVEMEYKLKLIEKDSLVKYKSKPINEVIFDAEYDVFFENDNINDETSIDHRLESSFYHEDIDEVLESEALFAIESGLSEWLIKMSNLNRIVVKQDMTLLVEFIDHKNGTPTYRIITEAIV